MSLSASWAVNCADLIESDFRLTWLSAVYRSVQAHESVWNGYFLNKPVIPTFHQLCYRSRMMFVDLWLHQWLSSCEVNLRIHTWPLASSLVNVFVCQCSVRKLVTCCLVDLHIPITHCEPNPVGYQWFYYLPECLFPTGRNQWNKTLIFQQTPGDGWLPVKADRKCSVNSAPYLELYVNLTGSTKQLLHDVSCGCFSSCYLRINVIFPVEQEAGWCGGMNLIQTPPLM